MRDASLNRPACQLAIVLLTDDLGSGTYANQANRLALGIVEGGRSQVTVLAYRGGERPPTLPAAICTERLGSSRAMFSTRRLVRYLCDRQPDVLVTRQVHMNLLAIASAWVARRCGWRGRLVVGHDHPLDLSHQENWRDNKYLARRLYPLADLITAVSPAVADDAVVSFGVPYERIVMVPNPIDRFDQHQPPPHPWLSDGAPTFVTVGRLVNYKRMDLVVDAVTASSPDARLLIIGRGAAADTIAGHVRARGVGHRVEMLGFVEDPRRYMSHATGFVLASEEEGFSQVLTEAMSTGCPVITTDAHGGGPRFVTQDGSFGLLVDRGDADGLADAARRLIDPSQRQVWSDRARRRAAEFSPAACAGMLIDGLVVA